MVNFDVDTRCCLAKIMDYFNDVKVILSRICLRNEFRLTHSLAETSDERFDVNIDAIPLAA